MTVSDKLKEIRISLNLTQDEFAEKIGISRESIAAYENKVRVPGVDIIKRVRETFNIPYNEICEVVVKNSNPKQGIKYLLITLSISLFLIISMLVSHFVIINKKYGYNIYNDELKVQNCSDICIVKVNYLEEDNKSEKIYNVSCIESLKKTSNIDRIYCRNFFSKININNIYLVFGQNSIEDDMKNVEYTKISIIYDQPFIIELKDYNESLKYDEQIGKCKNTINYYVNLIKE